MTTKKRSSLRNASPRRSRASTVVVLPSGASAISDVPLDSSSSAVALGAAKSTEPSGTITWYVNGRPNTRVTLVLSRVANSGGHSHPGGPVGTVAPAAIDLGPNYPQNIPVIFTAPEAAGTITLTMSTPDGPIQVTNNVLVSGLVPLDATTGISLTGSSAQHPTNHFGVAGLVTAIQELGRRFHSQFNKNLFVNDISLPWGGIYDFKSTWQPPHKTHRLGRDVDVNRSNMSDAERQFFQQNAEALGFRVELHPPEPLHWHLSLK